MIIPVGAGLMRLVFRQVGGIHDVVVTCGYDPGTIDPLANASLIYNSFVASGRPGHATSMSSQWTFQGVSVTEQSETGPIGAEVGPPITGSTAHDVLPPNCAILISKNTASGGRRNRGRMYVPPVFPAEGVIGPTGVLANADVTTLQARWGAFRTDLVSAACPPVILHSEPPFTPTPITAFVVQSRIATQRRRLRR